MNGLPTLALTAGVVNFRSLATTVTVLPGGLPAGTALASRAADVPEQADSTAARTIGPRVRSAIHVADSLDCRDGSDVVVVVRRRPRPCRDD